MEKKQSSTPSPTRPETPEALCRALKSAAIASAELVQTSKSLLQSSSPESAKSAVPSKQPPLAAITTLASLVHSHTVRTALTCGPTASSPSATLGCIKDLHEPILPIMTEYQTLVVVEEYPQFFVDKIRQEIIRLLDGFGPFVAEVVEIACGEAGVESRKRLQHSGIMMESARRIQHLCKTDPVHLLREKLNETQEMLNDAIVELQTILNPDGTLAQDDGWPDTDITTRAYTPAQKSLATRVEQNLRLLHLLYKATSRRRLTNVTYFPTMRGGIDVVNHLLTTLSVDVDNLVSGISDQEDPMGLELTLVQLQDAGRKLATAVRIPFDHISDDREGWFDAWLEKFV